MKYKFESPVYPFTAIVGQEDMKTALILNVINPRIGGVLIRGERGTAKSTVVRALARLLPPIKVVADCPFQCHPQDTSLMCPNCLERFQKGDKLLQKIRQRRVVNLPIGTTEDRLLGTIDLEAALTEGKRRFEPGLLAQANRALLYVDEVNLLSDHIVDLLLDVAAMGVNRVEREGLSFIHPSSFTLIGTMNPEEGDLRPQLLDRFGLCVEVKGIEAIDLRSEVVRRRIAFEADPEGFIAAWKEQEEELSNKIEKAKASLSKVQVPDRILNLAARFSVSIETEGHRADLTMVKTAIALCALEGRLEVSEKDLVRAAEMAIPHRLKRQELTKTRLSTYKLHEILEEYKQEEEASGTPPPPPSRELKKKLKSL